MKVMVLGNVRDRDGERDGGGPALAFGLFLDHQ